MILHYRVPRPDRILREEEQAMTIGIGFRCSDGMVFCADRQITDAAGLKYEKDKILTFSERSPDKRGFSLMLTYSGNPTAAATMFDRIITKAKTFRPPNSRSSLKRIFDCKYSRRLKTIIAVNIDGATNMWRTEGEQVHEANMEYIGAGDSSIVRYLAEISMRNRNQLSGMEAKMIGLLLVSAANRYVEGCSGGPNIVSINEFGNIESMSQEAIWRFQHSIKVIENQFAQFFSSFAVVDLEGIPLDRLSTDYRLKATEQIFGSNGSTLHRLQWDIQKMLGEAGQAHPKR